MIYIKNTVKSNYLELDTELDSNSFEIGTTYEDYLNGKYVLLTSELLDFKLNNQNASIKEVFEMKLNEETFDDVKNEMLLLVALNDTSDNVNSFYFNNNQYWFDKDTRIGLVNSITLLKNNGYTEATLWLNNDSFILPCEYILSMLNDIELYAVQCYNRTQELIKQINNCSTIEELKSINYLSGYPNKCLFNYGTLENTEK